MLEKIKEYWGLLLGAFLTLAYLFIRRNNDKRIEAEADASNVEARISDAKLQVHVENFLDDNKELMIALAKLEEEEKKAHAATLTPKEVEDYWNKRGK